MRYQGAAATLPSGRMSGAVAAPTHTSDTQVVAELAKKHKRTLLGGIAAAILIVLGLAYLLRPTLPPPTVSGYAQLTMTVS